MRIAAQSHRCNARTNSPSLASFRSETAQNDMPFPDPMAHLEPADGSAVAVGRLIGRGPDEHVNRMEAPLIHERGDRLAGNVVEPTTNQWKTDGRQILDRRREIQFAQEPRFHRMLMGRLHVQQMRISERADVITDDLIRNGGRVLHDTSRARKSHDLN